MKKINDNPNQYRYDITNCSSATECTGLIPTALSSEEELMSYYEIFHFGLPELEKPER